VVSFELDQRHVVEYFLDAPVIDPVDVVERYAFDVLDVALAVAANG
jgi:hypothetical protein